MPEPFVTIQVTREQAQQMIDICDFTLRNGGLNVAKAVLSIAEIVQAGVSASAQENVQENVQETAQENAHENAYENAQRQRAAIARAAIEESIHAGPVGYG